MVSLEMSQLQMEGELADFWIILIIARMMNGVAQASCAYMPPTNLVIAERKRDTASAGIPLKPSLRKRSSTSGTFFPETNSCGPISTTYFNVTLVTGSTYRLRLVNSGKSTPRP